MTIPAISPSERSLLDPLWTKIKSLMIIILLLYVHKAIPWVIGYKALVWSVEKVCNYSSLTTFKSWHQYLRGAINAYRLGYKWDEMHRSQLKNWNHWDTELHCDHLTAVPAFLPSICVLLRRITFLILCILKMWLLRPKGCLSAVGKPRLSGGMTMQCHPCAKDHYHCAILMPWQATLVPHLGPGMPVTFGPIEPQLIVAGKTELCLSANSHYGQRYMY